MSVVLHGWPSGRRATLPVVVQLRPVGGSFVHWSMPKLYELIGGATHLPWSRFRKRIWKTWRIFLNDLRLGSTALLDAPPWGREATSEESSVGPWALGSTHALLALLVRVSGPFQQNGRVDALEPGAEEMLASFASYLPSEFDLVVKLENAQWVPPYCVEGEFDLKFHVTDGVVDLVEAQLTAPVAMQRALPGLAGQSSCSVAELLQGAPIIDIALSRHVGFLDQFVWQLGSLLEPGLLQLPLTTLSNNSWFDDAAPLTFRDDLSKHERELFLRAYSKATGELIDSEQFVGVALDDSRVARRPWKLISVVFPSCSTAAWLCPQALGTTRTKFYKCICCVY